MRTNRVIHVVGCHAGGEVGDVVVGGVHLSTGDSLWDQARSLARDRQLKDFLLNEPRGGVFRHVNVLVPPQDSSAAIGNIILEPETVPPMSGSNTICVVTVVLETGILPMREPITRMRVEMPGGLIDVSAHCQNGVVESVEFTNIPSFVDRENVPLEVEGVGTLMVDTLFGGDSFVAVDAGVLGFAITSDEATELVEMGRRITAAANEQLGFSHPILSGMDGMDDITFTLMAHPPRIEDGRRFARHCVSIKPGKLDRSPTGTAVSARMAQLHSRGEVKIGDEVVFQSLLGSEFVGGIAQEEMIGGKACVRPTVRGRAWITSINQLMLDPTDPWPTGYRVSDTWPLQK